MRALETSSISSMSQIGSSSIINRHSSTESTKSSHDNNQKFHGLFHSSSSISPPASTFSSGQLASSFGNGINKTQPRNEKPQNPSPTKKKFWSFNKDQTDRYKGNGEYIATSNTTTINLNNSNGSMSRTTSNLFQKLRGKHDSKIDSNSFIQIPRIISSASSSISSSIRVQKKSEYGSDSILDRRSKGYNSKKDLGLPKSLSVRFDHYNESIENMDNSMNNNNRSQKEDEEQDEELSSPHSADNENNSREEYGREWAALHGNDAASKENSFEQLLYLHHGLRVKTCKDDGACLFRAIAYQLFGNEEVHLNLRQECMDYMTLHKAFFRGFMTEDFDKYVARKRRASTFGNNLELQALSDLYGRAIHVYKYSTNPIIIIPSCESPHSSDSARFTPIQISYHRNNHYNALVPSNEPPPFLNGRSDDTMNSTFGVNSNTHIQQWNSTDYTSPLPIFPTVKSETDSAKISLKDQMTSMRNARTLSNSILMGPSTTNIIQD